MRFSAAVSLCVRHSQKLNQSLTIAVTSQKLIHRLKRLSESCFKIVQLHLKIVQLHQRKFATHTPVLAAAATGSSQRLPSMTLA
jgi:hypothetical protein